MNSEAGRARQRYMQAVRFSDLSLVGLVLLVALVGVVAALGVQLFEAMVDGAFEFGYTTFPAWLAGHGLPTWTAYLVYPAVFGLAVAGVKVLVPRLDRLHSVPLVIVSMVKRGGRIRLVSTLLKTLTAVLTLGSGGSLGREGPVVLLGGGLASAVGQAFRVREDWLNTMVAAGAGAAIATAFHAPITGAFFAMEIVLIQFSAQSFALAALASVSAIQFSRLLMKGPPFPIPAYQMHSNWEIALFLLLGLATAPVARAYIHTLYGSEHLGKRITWLPDWIKPALGGILFGTLGLLIPHTLGAGYDTITIALAGKVSLGVMALLLAGKFLAIGLTSGSGWPGGVFTPALFLGAMFGGTFGALMQLVLPGIVTQPGIFAVVGMAAMIAGATQAPLTAMALIFEVTQDYRIALPAMLACGVAAVFSQRFSHYSVDTLHLPEAGVLLPWEFHDLRAMRVAEVMRTDVHVVRDTMQLHDVINLMHQHHHGGYPVLSDDGKLVGLITLGDVREVPLERRLVTPVADVMARDLAVVTPDESIADAARLMARRRVGRVPVVDAADSTRLVGILSRSDILRAYPADETQPAGLHGEEVQAAFLER